MVDFLTWFFALYPVWILGCGFLLWRDKEYRTNGDALVHTAVTLPFAVGMAILFYIWPLLLFGWGAWPYTAIVLFLTVGFEIRRFLR